MDYTTLALVQSAMGSLDPNYNPLGTAEATNIGNYITRVSRAIDRDVTNAATGSDDYFKSETVTAEITRGQLDKNGNIVTYFHKPIVTAVTTFEYRFTPAETWLPVLAANIDIEGYTVTAYTSISGVRGKVFVRATYTGGLAAATANMPADLVEAATVLVIRYYKEARAGLEDVVGVSDFGQPVYTKSMPARVKAILSPYERPIPW